jgi:Glyoxalase-like domain
MEAAFSKAALFAWEKASGMTIDHVTVCGDDLERMRQGFAKIGVATDYGGAHANGLTHMALAGFEDGSYLELIAPPSGADLAKASGMMSGWVPLMTGNAGTGAWAIRASAIHERADELRERGIAVRGPERGGRTRPDGIRLEWETAIVGAGAAGSVLPFMIEDRTERSLRVEPSVNQLGARGVAAVVIGVGNLSKATELFRRAFGWEAPAVEEHPEFGARLAQFRGTPVILGEALATGAWLAKRLTRFGEGPAAFLFSKTTAFREEAVWFERPVSWCPEQETGTRIGVIGM